MSKVIERRDHKKMSRQGKDLSLGLLSARWTQQMGQQQKTSKLYNLPRFADTVNISWFLIFLSPGFTILWNFQLGLRNSHKTILHIVQIAEKSLKRQLLLGRKHQKQRRQVEIYYYNHIILWDMELSLVLIFQMGCRSDVYPYSEPEQDPAPAKTLSC